MADCVLVCVWIDTSEKSVHNKSKLKNVTLSVKKSVFGYKHVKLYEVCIQKVCNYRIRVVPSYKVVVRASSKMENHLQKKVQKKIIEQLFFLMVVPCLGSGVKLFRSKIVLKFPKLNFETQSIHKQTSIVFI